MARKSCLVRLKKEMSSFVKEPPPYIPAIAVNENNMLTWHFLIEGPPQTPYNEGWYIGKLGFEPDYPFAPPAISMVTPTGRFKTSTRLCLSMSDFHPELWNPMWSVSTVCTGLLSFMLEETATTGSIETSEVEKRQIAASSLLYIQERPMLRNLFPDLSTLVAEAQERRKAGQHSGGAVSTGCLITGATGQNSQADQSVDSTAGSAESSRQEQEGLDVAGRHAEYEAAPSAGTSEVEQAVLPVNARESLPPAGVSSSGGDLGLQAGTGHEGGGPPGELAGRLRKTSLERAGGHEAGGHDLEKGEQGPVAGIQFFDKLLSRPGCHQADVLLQRARTEVVLGELDAAESSLEEAAECIGMGQAVKDAACPELADAGGIAEELARVKLGARHRVRGNELYRKRNFVGALRAYESGLKSLKDCATLHCNKGMALAALGRHQPAVEACTKALELDSSCTKARRQRADSLVLTGQPRAAAADYAALLLVNPEDMQLQQLLSEHRVSA